MACRAIYLAFLFGVCSGCSCADLTRPPPHELLAGALSPAPPDAPAASAPAPTGIGSTALAGEHLPGEGETIGASHILVAYRGAIRAKPTVTRTKEEARALATKFATQAHQPGIDFAKLAQDVSDAPSGIEGGA